MCDLNHPESPKGSLQPISMASHPSVHAPSTQLTALPMFLAPSAPVTAPAVQKIALSVCPLAACPSALSFQQRDPR